MLEQLTIKNLYNHMDETIAKDIFEGVTYPWEVLPKISDFIKELGKTLPADEYDQVGEDVWIAKSATVLPDSLHSWTGDHRKERRSPSVCIHPWKRDRRRRCSGR